MLFEKADGIVDLRDKAEFRESHLKGATWLSLELLPESLNALPASPATLFLVGNKEQIEAASLLLDTKGYVVNGSLVIEAEQDLQAWNLQMPDKFASGNDSRQLWQPCSLVKEFVAKLADNSLLLNSVNKRPKVLDIGCGGGRDAIYLAKQKMDVIAIDHEAKVLKRAKSLAQLSGANLKFKCCDIKKAGCLPDEKFDVITVVRFLNRELYSYIKQALKPGGVILFETFSSGVEKIGTPKNPNFILNENELREVFADFTVIVDRITELADGRPVNSFIAQKPID